MSKTFKLSALVIMGWFFMFGLAQNAKAVFLGCDWDGDLYSVNSSTAALSFIGSTGLFGLGSLEFASDGTLYGFTSGSGASLYRIDPTTAAATLVGSLNVDVILEGGLAFSPAGVAYGVHTGSFGLVDSLVTIDLNTGAATTVAPIGTDYHDINSLMWRSDGTLVGVTDDVAGGSLISIDPTTGAVGSIASLSFPVGALGGMAFDDGTGISYFGTSQDFGNDANLGSNSLYNFNPYNGVSGLIGSFSGFNDPFSEGISGLAISSSVVPEPTTLSLLGLGLLGLGASRRKFWKR